MASHIDSGEFPEHTDENRTIWEENADWWDDKIGEGNDFQIHLIEPATHKLLQLSGGENVLDIACGAGRLARQMAEKGARVTAIDQSSNFIKRAQSKTPQNLDIDYRVVDATDAAALSSLGESSFDYAVCTMGIMDIPVLTPMMHALRTLLKPNGQFIFSITHPCFHSAAQPAFAERVVTDDGRHYTVNGVKVSHYITPRAFKTEGIVGQPAQQFSFHRPLQVLFAAAFAEGFAINGLEEPVFTADNTPRSYLKWKDMPEIPPVLAVRMIRLQ